MKNLVNSYIDHPELIKIFLILLITFMIIVPIINLFIYKIKKNNLQLMIKNNGITSNEPLNNSIKCNLCGSNRYIKELLYQMPLDSKFGLFFIKEYGFINLYQIRCGKCSSKLIRYTEQSDCSK